MSVNYESGVYCAVVGDYLYAMDVFNPQSLMRANKATMEVTKRVTRSDYATPWHQRDSLYLYLNDQQSASPYLPVMHILDMDMVELSSFVMDTTAISHTAAACFQTDAAYMAIADDKIYCYLGQRWSASPMGYYATIRVYNNDGSYTDYSGAVVNGTTPPLPSNWAIYLAILAAAQGNASATAAACQACRIIMKDMGHIGTDVVSSQGAPWPANDPAATNPRRIASADLQTVTVSAHLYINPYSSFRMVGGVASNGFFYAFMPAPPVEWEDEEWVGDSPTTLSLWKYDVATMELISWLDSPNGRGLVNSDIGAIVANDTYAWGCDSGGEPLRITLADNTLKTLWSRSGSSNAIWFVNSV
jgi:hypothetical protein